MNFLILGDGFEERAWAMALEARTDHRVVAAFPGVGEDWTEVQIAGDFEEALALSDVEAVIVGGPIDLRDEWLRRVAATGLPAICLHPSGPNADAYYQVALSREETGAIVVPDMPGRLHPGVVGLRDAVSRGDVGSFRGLSIEAPGDPSQSNLAIGTLPRWVDVARVFLGDVQSLTAIGDPPGESPSERLTVQLRGASGRLAEVRIGSNRSGIRARLVVTGETGSLFFEVDPNWEGPSELSKGDGSNLQTLTAWNPREAMLGIFAEAVAGRPVRPNLLDGTRAMEVTSAVTRGLRRGRAVDLNYEEVSESGNFKTIMTSIGCMMLLGILVVLPAALVGPALGIGQTIYIAYAIPPILIGFALLQTLRLAIRPGKSAPNEPSS